MSKQKTKRTKNQVTIGEREKARIERWRKQVKAWIDKTKDNECYFPGEWIEEIEGRPIVDVITDRITTKRLKGFWAQYDRPTDECYEDAGTRSRNANEKAIARQAVHMMLMIREDVCPKNRLHELIKWFYRKGDYGLDEAVKRAVVDALDWEKEAECADEPIDIQDLADKLDAETKAKIGAFVRSAGGEKK